jgi:hypothetical protein
LRIEYVNEVTSFDPPLVLERLKRVVEARTP